jgi:hypothetical protein
MWDKQQVNNQDLRPIEELARHLCFKDIHSFKVFVREKGIAIKENNNKLLVNKDQIDDVITTLQPFI